MSAHSPKVSEASTAQPDPPRALPMMPTRQFTLRLFPTLVEVLEFEDDETLAGLRAAAHDLWTTDHTEVIGATRGMEDWISRPDIHELDGFRDHAAMLGRTATARLQAQGLAIASVGVTSMWILRQGPHTFRDVHSHHNSYLSGVHYLDVPAGSGAISFVDPLLNFKSIRPERTTPSDDHGVGQFDGVEELDIAPRDNLALIFPSWLYHCIRPSGNVERPRISLAFNMMPTGSIGGARGRFDYRHPPADRR